MHLLTLLTLGIFVGSAGLSVVFVAVGLVLQYATRHPGSLPRRVLEKITR